MTETIDRTRGAGWCAAAAALLAALIVAPAASADVRAPSGASWDAKPVRKGKIVKRKQLRLQRKNTRLHGRNSGSGSGSTSSGPGDGSGTAPTPITNYSANITNVGSMYNTTLITGARDYWNKGYTGKGIDIALIDSGVAPVEGLKVTGKVVNGPDLSFESQDPDLRYLDTYGHGTHLAGVIAGRGPNAVAGQYVGDKTSFFGMAPDARLLSLKVAESNGATDVSQVIAAIDWVVQHRRDNGMNIRVLCLAYGTDATQSYLVDPLAYAVEQAWKAGIVVVTAAGNAGFAKGGSMTNPAINPFVIAVGATNPMGTVSKSDDVVADFSSTSLLGLETGTRHVDFLAPGKSIVSLRVPSSHLDAAHASTGAVTPGLFRGSGTSQSAAVVAGGAALLLQKYPSLTPAQVKAMLAASSIKVANANTAQQGAGQINLSATLSAKVPVAAQGHEPSVGRGSLELSRGSVHLTNSGVTLAGERDIFGKFFDSPAMALLEATASSWSGGVWNGSTWTGSSWSGSSWSGSSWSASSWSGSSWSGSSWSLHNFASSSGSGSSWSASSWSSSSWSSSSWSASSWSSSSWS